MSRRNRKLAKVERRSDEARLKKRRSRTRTKFAIIGLVGLSALVLLAIGGCYAWFRSYLNSQELREMVEQKVGEQLDAEVKLTDQEWQGSEVSVKKTTIRGNGKIEAIDLIGLEANFDFDGLWDKKVKITEATVNQLKLVIDQRTDITSGSEDDVVPETEASAESAPSGFFSRFAPEETIVEKIKIGRSNFTVRSDLGEYQLNETRLAVSPFPGQINGRRLSFSGGRLKFPIGPFPELDLNNASLRVNDDSVFLSQADLRYGESGTLDLSGEWERQGGSWKVTGSGDRIDCDELLPPAWHDSVDGIIRFNANADGKPESDTRWKGDIEIEKAALKSLSFLDTLAAYTGKIQFSSPSFEEATFRFQQEGETLRIYDLNFYSRNLARIEGEVSVTEDQVDGILMVGIPPGTLSFIPGAETKVFTASNNGGRFGWLWAPVHITGIKGEWTEDLTKRLIDAAGERMFELVPETGERILKFTQKSVQDILRNPVGGGLNSVRDGVDLLDDTIGGGLGVIPGGLFPPIPRDDDQKEDENSE